MVYCIRKAEVIFEKIQFLFYPPYFSPFFQKRGRAAFPRQPFNASPSFLSFYLINPFFSFLFLPYPFEENGDLETGRRFSFYSRKKIQTFEKVWIFIISAQISRRIP